MASAARSYGRHKNDTISATSCCLAHGYKVVKNWAKKLNLPLSEILDPPRRRIKITYKTATIRRYCAFSLLHQPQ